MVERGLSPHTLAAYRRDLQRYVDFVTSAGCSAVREINVEHLRNHLVALSKDGLAASSVARASASLRGFHGFALKEGWVDVDVSADIASPQLGRRLPKALSLDDVARLLDACSAQTPLGLRDRALVELLYGTGARVSEVVQLDVGDVWDAMQDSDAGIRVVGKGNKERIVPLGSFAREALDAWFVRGRPTLTARAKATTNALFVNLQGRRLSRTSAFNAVREAAARAHLTVDVSPHTLRHSFATHMLDGGADVRSVQELLGHASVTTTQLYTLVTSQHLREVYLASHPRAY